MTEHAHSSRPALHELPESVDVLIVGGGITGAGILSEATRSGLRALLVEAEDFASGTSSWSSKLVHGGLRYLKTGQWRLTLESVRERKRLLGEAPGLVEPLRFVLPIYYGRKPSRWVMRLGLFLYDLMAGQWRSRWLNAAQVLSQTPQLAREGLSGAVSYEDAQTDDVRLVLRLIFDAVAAGGQARNYIRAELQRDGEGRVIGARLTDTQSGGTRDIRASVVILATGAWAQQAPGAPPLRPLRGSHYIFPQQRLPLTQAISWLHPQDQRPVFAYPWEGAVVYGTTDLDHDGPLDAPLMSAAESAYLMQGLQHQFPGLRLRPQDAISRYAGVRPVVAGGAGDPSAESRESACWSAPGLVCITGGKLTTFRVTAREVLARAAAQMPNVALRPPQTVFTAAHVVPAQRRLYGRYGIEAAGRMMQEVPGEESAFIEHTPYRWGELRWAARHEQVLHLDDLLLRRTRLGLVLPHGAAALFGRLQEICRVELGWDRERWAQEQARYQALWHARHAPA